MPILCTVSLGALADALYPRHSAWHWYGCAQGWKEQPLLLLVVCVVYIQTALLFRCNQAMAVDMLYTPPVSVDMPCRLRDNPAWVQLSREELNVLRHCKSTLNKLLGRMRLCRKVRTSSKHVVVSNTFMP